MGLMGTPIIKRRGWAGRGGGGEGRTGFRLAILASIQVSLLPAFSLLIYLVGAAPVKVQHQPLQHPSFSVLPSPPYDL